MSHLRRLYSRNLLVLIIVIVAVFGVAQSAVAQGNGCAPPQQPTFTVVLPKVTNPPNPLGWDLPLVWGPFNSEVGASDTITVPNGRPIYALFVSGYANNVHLDQLMAYRFARHLMNEGAYVHWAWWNNLLAPYMERPLHHDQSHPGTAADLAAFTNASDAELKAMPGENYQFLSDAKLFLQAIRANNPEAVIILVGHSMGGRSVADLANETNVLIDLVAPIDPVANRTYPWAGPTFQNASHYNWTRYRATRETFNGYRSMEWQALPLPGQCVPVGPWTQTWAEASAGSVGLCAGQVHVHGAPHMTFGSNIINLHHRWQHEDKFPYDYEDAWFFNPAYPFPPGGSQSQIAVTTNASGPDPGGWPSLGGNTCCPSGSGQAWGSDGHGEIIGARGPVPPAPKPLGFQVRTSPECGSGDPCEWGVVWPARTWTAIGGYDNGNSAFRMQLLKDLESTLWHPDNPGSDIWVHRPHNSGLCLVSPGLVSKFESMDKPPVADAGGDQVIECAGCDVAMVTLDATSSFDPDGLPLTFTWTGPFGARDGTIVQVELAVGSHCITLEVSDSVGHIAQDFAIVTIADTTAPTAPYSSNAGVWKKHAGDVVAYAFDEFFPGIPNGAGCLLSSPADPVQLQLAGGSLTVWATQSGDPYCVITDSSTAPAVSDANLKLDAVVVFDFNPPVSAFYTYFGSLAAGETATMTLLDEEGAVVDSLTTLPSTDNARAAGQGFISSIPVKRIEFTSSDDGSTLIGAFTGLKPSEPSLGAIDLGNYQGPAGSGVIELDFACSFVGACLGDLVTSDTFQPPGDGDIDGADLAYLLGDWGRNPGSLADLVTSETFQPPPDGIVDGADLAVLLGAWGECD